MPKKKKSKAGAEAKAELEVSESASEVAEAEPKVEPQAEPQVEPKDEPQTTPQTKPQTPETNPKSSPESLHQQIGKLAAQLEATENERDDIQDQYEELLDKVGHIKSTLGERLKKDAAELTTVKRELQQLKDERDTLKQHTLELEPFKAQAESLATKLSYSELQIDTHAKQTKELESQIAQLQQDVAEQTRYAEHYRKSMQDAAASAESERTKLEKQIADLKIQVAEKSTRADQHSQEIEALKAQLSERQSELQQHKTSSQEIESLNETVREKTILIGKLRHEAVILNEHLTNALRIVKRDSEGQTVDKELVSNLIVQFVQLPRGDTKKFEVLQLIAGFLSWDEERRIEVGLARQGGPGPAGTTSLGGFLGKFAEFMERESRR